MLLHGSCNMFLPGPVKGLYARNGRRVNSSQFMDGAGAFCRAKADNAGAGKSLMDVPEPFWSWETGR
jgi:hypothetical protein